VVGRDVWEVVDESLSSGGIFQAFNSCLIPKEIVANRIDKFCPISLCNVIYKVRTKGIANRLKPIMFGITSQGPLN
jgi:hypothetical protein